MALSDRFSKGFMVNGRPVAGVYRDSVSRSADPAVAGPSAPQRGIMVRGNDLAGVYSDDGMGHVLVVAHRVLEENPDKFIAYRVDSRTGEVSEPSPIYRDQLDSLKSHRIDDSARTLISSVADKVTGYLRFSQEELRGIKEYPTPAVLEAGREAVHGGGDVLTVNRKRVLDAYTNDGHGRTLVVVDDPAPAAGGPGLRGYAMDGAGNVSGTVVDKGQLDRLGRFRITDRITLRKVVEAVGAALEKAARSLGSAAVHAGAAARAVAAGHAGAALTASRQNRILSGYNNLESGFAVYRLDEGRFKGKTLVVLNKRISGRSGYEGFLLDKEGGYPDVPVSDSMLAHIHSSFAAGRTSDQLAEEMVRNDELLREHGFNVRCHYAFVDCMMGRGKNSLVMQESYLVNMAREGKLPVFSRDDSATFRSSRGDVYYEFPPACILDSGRTLEGMAYLSASAQCREQKIGKDGNTYVLTTDRKMAAPGRISLATPGNGSLTGAVPSRINTYTLRPRSLDVVGDRASGAIRKHDMGRAAAADNAIKSEGVSLWNTSGNKSISYIPTRADMTLVDFMASYMVAARIGAAIRTTEAIREKFRAEFVRTAQEMGRNGRFGDFYRTFNTAVMKRSREIEKTRVMNPELEQKKSVERLAEYRRDRESHGYAM